MQNTSWGKPRIFGDNAVSPDELWTGMESARRTQNWDRLYNLSRSLQGWICGGGDTPKELTTLKLGPQFDREICLKACMHAQQLAVRECSNRVEAARAW